MIAAANDLPSTPVNTRPRIAVLGANGRLGKALMKGLSSKAEMIPLTRSELDLAHPEAIEGLLDDLKPSLLIITAAMTAVDYCEDHRDEAFAVNADGPGVIARAGAAAGVKVVYFSTDFVFDGERLEGSYTEEDEVRPISAYGASKRGGEEQVLAASPSHLVARVSWLYGQTSAAFPEWIIRQAMEKETLALPAEKTGSPTSAEDVADYLALLLGLADRPAASGVVHLCNSGSCSWQEWGQFCLDTASDMGLPLKARTIGANAMEDIAAFVARRPRNSIMDNARYTALTGVTPRDWKCALRDHLQTSELLLETPSPA